MISPGISPGSSSDENAPHSALDVPAGTPKTVSDFVITFDGRPIPCRPGWTVGAALMAAGVRSWRTTRVHGRPRGLFCGMGVCFDCLVTVDGRTSQRACLTPAEPDAVVTTQHGSGLDRD